MHQLVHYVKLIGVGGWMTRCQKPQTNSHFRMFETLTGVPSVLFRLYDLDLKGRGTMHLPARIRL
jgi:hypothetical protein